ncbi:MAG: hypothetical protein M1820_001988 [Bogoriella megaspora]|nr:MAG: hypothetical protein M1820_001988 [Bogoriella megaspora]
MPEEETEKAAKASQDSADAGGVDRSGASTEEKPKILSWLKQAWAKTGLDLITILIMAKYVNEPLFITIANLDARGAVAPTIALAIYQSDAVARQYSTLGYLVAIMTILGMPIMPRAKFIQTLALNVITACFSAAVSILALWSSVQARVHTTPRVAPGTGGPGTVGTPSPGAQTGGYNSSQSAVCAIWLFFQIYAVNTFRCRFPQFMFPCIIYSVFVVVSMSYGPNFTTTTQALNFARQLLEAFLTGFGIAFGVHFVVLPLSSRKIVFKVIPGMMGAIRGSLKAHGGYVKSLETSDMFLSPVPTQNGAKSKSKGNEAPKSKEAMAFKQTIGGITALAAKLHAELPFAKREIAYGKLCPEDLNELSRLLQYVNIPLMGLGTVSDIFERVSHIMGWERAIPSDGDSSGEEFDQRKVTAVNAWHQLAKVMHDPIENLTRILDDGMHHAMLRLEFAKPLKRRPQFGGEANADVEAKGDSIEPGDDGFAEHLDIQIQEFKKTKQPMLRKYCELGGVDMPPDFFDRPATDQERELWETKFTSEERQHKRRQLYLLLYICLLLESTSHAILDLVLFADMKKSDGTMSKNRLIFPGYRRIRKQFTKLFTSSDESANDMENNNQSSSDSQIYLGAAFQQRKDPEHLPPQNSIEKIGNWIRLIPRGLGSRPSVFGFRAACAIMSIGIVGFLNDTHHFYTVQRLFWGMIMIAISMTPTAGQALLNFVFRILGTALAMIFSYVAWYIVVGHTAGVIVFYFLFCPWGYYFLLKMPRFTVVGIIFSVTLTLILGYELQVQQIGVQASTSNGQPYYPLYSLAPYRLATVVGGLFVAFIWTIFPYPITEHSELRHQLGSSLYLLANMYSVVHETVKSRIQGTEGDLESKDSPGRKLEKARTTILNKQTVLLQTMQQTVGFLSFEIPVGGRFPKETYVKILKCVENVQNYTMLLGYSSRTFAEIAKRGAETDWVRDFRAMLESATFTSNQITSLLSLLSSSIEAGQPLPPYLKAPEAFELTTKIESFDKDILSVRHLAEPGYAAFAVMQVTTHCIVSDVDALLGHVRSLIGELDFSFHAISVAEGGQGSGSEDSLLGNKSGKGKRE